MKEESALPLHTLESFFPDRNEFLRANGPHAPDSNITFTAPENTGIEDATANRLKSNGDTRATKKPLFVMHVGIHKTGTTFLQGTIGSMYARKQSPWKQDNFAYLGTYLAIPASSVPAYGHRNFAATVFQPKDDLLHGYVYDPVYDRNITDAWKMNKNFVASIKHFSTMNTNVLFIFEPMSQFRHEQIKLLKELIEPYWDIQVIVSYRRLYEWLTSFYNQIAKGQKDWPAYGPEHDAAYPISFDIDTSEVDNGPALFSSIRTRRFYAQSLKFRKHPTELVMDNYRRYLTPHVSVLPAPQDIPPSSTAGVDPMLEYIFCSDLFMVKASHVCDELRQGNFNDVFPDKSLTANSAEVLDYDLLAVAAYRNGLVPAKKGRVEVSRAIQTFTKKVLKRKPTDLPQTCMSTESTQKLEDFSFYVEQRLFPSMTDKEREASKQKFHEAFWARNLTLCHVDTNATLADPKWQSYFKSRW